MHVLCLIAVLGFGGLGGPGGDAEWNANDISGRVFVENETLAGISLSSLQLALLPQDNLPTTFLTPLRLAELQGSAGDFRFPGVPPGKYRLQMLPPPPGFHVADVLVGSQSIFSDVAIDVGSDPLEPIAVMLKRGGGGTVQGVVVGPVPKGSRAVLVPSHPRRQNDILYKSVIVFENRGQTGEFPFFTTTVDETQAVLERKKGIHPSGPDFLFHDVPPGEYKVFVWESLPSGGVEHNDQFISRYEEFGVPLTVGPGEMSNVRVELIPEEDR